MKQQPMSPLVLLVLILAMVVASVDGAWCVCRADASSTAQQTTIDYACGAGANCGPILQNGACYNPNTLLGHCSYAANSFYQINNQDQQACNFSGTAQLVAADPSTAGCTYPATPSAAGTGGTPSTPPTTTTPSPPTTPSTPSPPTSGFSPNTPSTGTGTGTGTGFGLGPTGAGLDPNDAAGHGPLPVAKLILLSPLLLFFLLRV